MDIKTQAKKELAMRELEKRHGTERDSLLSFITYFFKNELNKDFQIAPHHIQIEDALNKVLTGEITRLLINIPPGSAKTELITKCFPVWAFGKKPDLRIIATGYSAQLTQSYGAEARDYYQSQTYATVFPRRSQIREDQNTKGLWKTDDGAQYLATGVGGSITGNRANIFLIDDPLKPDEALSDVKRTAVNRWYDNTVLSRLFNPNTDSVIIVMQRTHDDDLCGYLMGKENTGEKWHKIIVPAIQYDADGNEVSYHPERFPLTALKKIQANNPTDFTTQYMQEPMNKDTQEFHEEFFQYYEELPKRVNGTPEQLRVFTVVDPAFKTNEQNDETAIITGGFIRDELYVLEITHGRLNATEVNSKLLYHASKWKPEKIGVEGYQAQTVMAQWMKKTLQEHNVFTPIDEIIQKGDKIQKIRGLQAPIRATKIKWKKEMYELELQLKKFPRGKHDDIIDALQMLYSFYNVQPNTEKYEPTFEIRYNHLGQPVFE